VAYLGGIQSRDLPSQIVIPRPGTELVDAHRHNHRRRTGSTSRSAKPGYVPTMQRGVIGCALRVAALADENGGSAGDVDTHWCGRAREVMARGLGCRWIVATSTRVCVLARTFKTVSGSLRVMRGAGWVCGRTPSPTPPI